MIFRQKHVQNPCHFRKYTVLQISNEANKTKTTTEKLLYSQPLGSLANFNWLIIHKGKGNVLRKMSRKCYRLTTHCNVMHLSKKLTREVTKQGYSFMK